MYQKPFARLADFPELTIPEKDFPHTMSGPPPFPLTLKGENARSYSCNLLKVFCCFGQEYIFLDQLQPISPAQESISNAIEIMHLRARLDSLIITAIEDDEEYEEVLARAKEHHELFNE